MEKVFGKLILKVANEPDQEFRLTQAVTTLGSADTNDIVIKQAQVSRAHARIECTDAGCTIFDLESAKGLLVNNRSVQQVNLASGDVIKLGEAELLFEASAGPNASGATILDAAVFAEDQAGQAPQPEATATPERHALVELQVGGSKTPFFCVTGRYGDVANFKTLARYLGPEQPFYALQPPKPANGPPPLTNLDALVAHYLDQISGKQAQGPYFIGGYNVGGLVAFEVAQQLQASGRGVALVALIDTPYLIKNPLPYWGYRSANTMKQTSDKLFEPLHNWVQTNIASRLTDPLKEMRSTLKGRWPRSVEWVVERMEEDCQTMQETLGDEGYETTTRVLQRYRPKPYPGPVALFLAEVSLVRYSGALWGWPSVVANGLKMYTVPGSYISILKEPNVQILAQHLTACLAP